MRTIIVPLSFVLIICSTVSVSAYSANHCLSYDGIDDFAATEVTTSYSVEKLTIEFWVKPQYKIEPGSDVQFGCAYGVVSTYRDISTHQGWCAEFNYNTGSLWFYFRSGGADRIFTTTRTIWDISWYHVAITYDNELPYSNVKFFVNSVLDKESDSSYVISYKPASLAVGSSPVNPVLSPFHGLIDEFRIWNVSRSQAEIQNTWNRTLNDTECGTAELIGYWRFDEGSGSTAADQSLRGIAMLLQAPTKTPDWVEVAEAPVVPEFLPVNILLILAGTGLTVAIVRKRNRRH